MKTTASVVVASKTQDALDRATKLAIVPYAEGQLTLQRQAPAASAQITEHYFGGQSHASRIAIQDGTLVIPLRESGDNGLPVEWIEAEISGA